jgi:hypothetical protein
MYEFRGYSEISITGGQCMLFSKVHTILVPKCIVVALGFHLPCPLGTTGDLGSFLKVVSSKRRLI